MPGIHIQCRLPSVVAGSLTCTGEPCNNLNQDVWKQNEVPVTYVYVCILIYWVRVQLTDLNVYI